ncbi:MAG: right-handed parallel beta-helix repeat-containing protein [Planctomycetes bacterium]|nr:right-handed parallel beta-helix repeat-containing protein [Planctomycetota bacterium]
MQIRFWISTLTVIFLAAVALGQTTWHVDDDAPNDPGPGDPTVSDPLEDGSASHPFDAIQEGIDAAMDGDEVVVLDGVYTGVGNRDLDFEGKAITVRSDSGDPTTCIIDCEGSDYDRHRGFNFHTGEEPNSVVDGIAITNGYADAGGGVYCYESHPTLEDCVISGNLVKGSSGTIGGSGVYCYSSRPTLTNCTISGNSAQGHTSSDDGGALYCDHRSAPTILDCTITGNRSRFSGAGVMCVGNSNPTFNNCTVSENWASDYGGGIRCSYSSPTFTNCTISGNSIDRKGGAVSCLGGRPAFARCTISGNVSLWGSGGGIHAVASDPTFTNCTISDNSTAEDGGAVYCYRSGPRFINCTMIANHAARGALLACDSKDHSDPSTVTMSHSILWNGDSQIWNNDGSALALTFCDVQGGWPGVGNIDADPLFAFPDDLHLAAGSPCIDAGATEAYDVLPTDDLDGNVRPLDGNGDTIANVDIGAYEFNPAAASIAVDQTEFVFSAPAGGDNPPAQMLSLRDCGGETLNWGISGQPAWLMVLPSSGQSDGEVDQVTLSPSTSGWPHGAYAAVLEVTDSQAVNSPRTVSVTLYLTTTLSVPSEYPTIQSAIDATVNGDVAQVADGTYTGEGNKNLDFGGKSIELRSVSGDPTMCVIDCEGNGRGLYFHNREGPDAVVDGFTITNGKASYGGAVHCLRSHPTFRNCSINGNSTTNFAYGGGIYCYMSHPTLSNCTISGNTATSGLARGGGVYCYMSNVTLCNCAINGNSVMGIYATGGGIYCGRSPTFTNCTINDNVVIGQYSAGGGVYCNGDPTFTNCSISANSADIYGGGVNCEGGSATFANCTINTNSTGYAGGGIYLYQSSPTLTDCIVSGNSADNHGGGIYCHEASNATLVNCTLAANTAVLGAGVACDSIEHLSPNTVALSNCILWDNNVPIWNNDDSAIILGYCDVQGGWFGEGNIDTDPLFVDPANDDYHLAVGSPCIDAGDPAFVAAPGETDMDGEYRLWDGDAVPGARVDMGADEFGSYRYGDLNCDGTIDTFDINPFILALQGPDYYDPVHTDCERMLADINADGVVNGFDIDPYIALLIGEQ